MSSLILSEDWDTKIVDKNKTPPFPSGIYDVILADPPWRYNNTGFKRGVVSYSTMKTEDICSLNPPIDENAILFLWATNPFLEGALKVIHSWKFEYKTNIVWVKKNIGTGFYVRGKHELLLICRRGVFPQPDFKNRPPSVLESSTLLGHSVKPKQVYEIIETMYPNRKYLELFARQNRKGWTSWGNEL